MLWCAVLACAGSASAQTRRASPSPSPKVSPSPSPSPALDAAETNATLDNATEPATTGPATATTGPARPRAAGAGGATNIPDKRIKALYDSPEAALGRIPELRELSKLVSASPAVTKLLQDKNLVATIFAPNNAVSGTRLQETVCGVATAEIVLGAINLCRQKLGCGRLEADRPGEQVHAYCRAR